jgi:hypothetical protein
MLILCGKHVLYIKVAYAMKHVFGSFRKKISDNTRVRIFFFFQNLTLGYMTKL